jgi:hypothetical protein
MPGMKRKVEDLMKQILEKLQLLHTSRFFKSENEQKNEKKSKELETAISQLSELPSSLPENEGQYNHYGPGGMFINPGDGTQHNYSQSGGSGNKQYIGQTPTLRKRLTSIPGSRDCPRPEILALLDFSHLRPRSYKHINHLLLFSSSLSTITSMRNNFMCSVDRTVVHSVAAVHLCPDFAPRAEATKLAGEVKTRCARFAAASGSSSTRMHAVSGCWRSLRRDCKRQTSRFERKLPVPLPGAVCQEPTDVAHCDISNW